MLKLHVPILRSYFTLINRSISTSDVLFGRWFYQHTKVKIPTQNIETFKGDWDQGVGLQMNRIEKFRGVEDIEEFHKLPDIVKKTYTYNFLPRQSAIDQEVADISQRLGIDKILDPLAYKVIASILLIRYKKGRVKEDSGRKATIFSTKFLIERRNDDLRALQPLNGKHFDAICKEFNIKYQDIEPEIQEPPDPKFEEVLDETTKLKEKKTKSFKEQLKDSEEEFYERKKKALVEIKSDLEKINLDIKQVYGEVIEERIEKAMKPIHDEEFRWLAREKELKMFYDKKRAEKKAAHERQLRR